MIGFEVVGLSFLTLCFTALQFAWLVVSQSTLMTACYEGPSDPPSRAQAAASRDWVHSWMDRGHTRGSNRYRVRYFIRWSKQ